MQMNDTFQDEPSERVHTMYMVLERLDTQLNNTHTTGRPNAARVSEQNYLTESMGFLDGLINSNHWSDFGDVYPLWLFMLHRLEFHSPIFFGIESCQKRVNVLLGPIFQDYTKTCTTPSPSTEFMESCLHSQKHPQPSQTFMEYNKRMQDETSTDHYRGYPRSSQQLEYYPERAPLGTPGYYNRDHGRNHGHPGRSTPRTIPRGHSSASRRS